MLFLVVVMIFIYGEVQSQCIYYLRASLFIYLFIYHISWSEVSVAGTNLNLDLHFPEKYRKINIKVVWGWINGCNIRVSNCIAKLAWLWVQFQDERLSVFHFAFMTLSLLFNQLYDSHVVIRNIYRSLSLYHCYLFYFNYFHYRRDYYPS